MTKIEKIIAEALRKYAQSLPCARDEYFDWINCKSPCILQQTPYDFHTTNHTTSYCHRDLCFLLNHQENIEAFEKELKHLNLHVSLHDKVNLVRLVKDLNKYLQLSFISSR